MVVRKLRRLAELMRLMRAAADAPSRRAISACYRDLGASLRDRAIISLSMRGTVGPLALRLRRSDILTLGEIFASRIYGKALPLPASPFIIDAGANIGLASAWFKAARPQARILAFEPDPGNAELARTNLDPLSGCETIEAALAESPGTARFHRGLHDATHSLVDSGAGVGSYEVQTRSVSEVMAGRDERQIDLLKLDVEGAELQVLAGMGEWLGRTQCIIGELHERFATQAELREILTGAGFRLQFFGLGEPGVQGFIATRSTR